MMWGRYRASRESADSRPGAAEARQVGRWALLAVVAWAACVPARAQVVRGIPNDAHFSSFASYLDGDYLTAGRLFSSTPRIKSTTGVWIDSIPYHAMIGECKYQMGDLAGALDQYTAALQVALAYPDWLMLLDLTRPVTPATRVMRAPPTWGVPTRAIRVASLPSRVGLRVGSEAQNALALQQGGLIQSPEIVMFNANEIVRCTVLALRRRAEILGPTGEHNSLTNQLVTTLQRRLAPPNHYAQVWISLELGLALVAKGKNQEAVSELNNSLLMNGMDHPLTSTVLLELGKLAFQAGDFAAAGVHFLEASYAAAMQADEDYTQYDIIAESLRWAMVTHLVTGKREYFAPLTMAADWARRSRVRSLEASVLLAAAENNASIGDAAQSGNLLKLAAAAMRNRDCLRGELGARFQYVTAHTFYLQGDMKRGSAALTTALTFQKAGASRRLFQIALVDGLFRANSITSRQADALFANVLRDPTPLDWATDPLESLAVLSIPHALPYEHWMAVALDRKEKDVALRISEALRRHHFYTSLPAGGRVLNLRWVLEAPAESLTPTAILHRQELLNRYPEYAQLLQESQQVRADLAALPTAAGGEQQQRQAALQTRLAEIGQRQERVLWSIGLGRERGEFVFPPTTDVTAVQQQLQPRQRVLVFVAAGGTTCAYMLEKEAYTTWQLEPWTKISPNVQQLLRELGLYDRNQPLGSKELGSAAWQDTAVTVLQQLTGNAPADAWDEFDELVIVPDGPLWYVPFEALQIQKGAEKISLLDKVRIRYAPTISLAVPDKTPRRRDARTAVVTGMLFAKSNETASAEVAASLQENDPNVFAVPLIPEPPAMRLSKTVDRLVVLNDLDNDPKAPYDWAPVAADKSKASASLGQWMLSPWGGPDQIVLPGFHTPAEMALKRGGTGAEMYLTICGLMSTGTRTILLSRWRDGGRTSYDLMREFVRELPHRTASEAWHRSVQLARQSDLDFTCEPRVKSRPTDTILKADHPFFWSGYMLVDTGVEPKND